MQHVIIGAGPAGVVAAESIRKFDKSSTVTLVSNESERPYSRLAIARFLQGEIEEDTYLNLQFNGDRLIGASCIGNAEHLRQLPRLIHADISFEKWSGVSSILHIGMRQCTSVWDVGCSSRPRMRLIIPFSDGKRPWIIAKIHWRWSLFVI